MELSIPKIVRDHFLHALKTQDASVKKTPAPLGFGEIRVPVAPLPALVFPVTFWSALLDVGHPAPSEKSWGALVEMLTAPPTPYPRKDAAPGFGPYCLHPVPGARRADRYVASMTLAVFDADEPRDWGAMVACDSLLAARNVARVWVSTYSYTYDRPAFRLVLPLARPVAPSAWPELRRRLIRDYAIPAAVEKCSSASHFYYLPACPPGAEAQAGAFSFAAGAEAVPVPILMPRASAPPSAAAEAAAAAPADFGAAVIPEQEAELRAAVERRAAGLARKKDGAERAAWLRRALAGEELAEHGSREGTTTRVALMLAHLVPDGVDEPGALVAAVLRASVEAMINAGSKLTWPAVERRITTAVGTVAASRAKNAEILGALGAT